MFLLVFSCIFQFRHYAPNVCGAGGKYEGAQSTSRQWEDTRCGLDKWRDGMACLELALTHVLRNSRSNWYLDSRFQHLYIPLPARLFRVVWSCSQGALQCKRITLQSLSRFNFATFITWNHYFPKCITLPISKCRWQRRAHGADAGIHHRPLGRSLFTCFLPFGVCSNYFLHMAALVPAHMC